MTDSCSNVTFPGPTLAEMCSSSTFVIFMSLIEELIRSNNKISGGCNRVKSIETPDEEYDFVVIGGGGAGAVVASRLSENPNWKVLVLEAGADEPAGGQIPLFATTLMGTTADWNYTTTNESYACLASNGSCSLSSGKMLGGGTAHNAMIYLRGVPMDYENWAAQGNEGWTWEEVKRFFLLAEDNGKIDRVGRFNHSTGGPLRVERFPHLPSFGHSCIAAVGEANYTVTEDLNGDPTGFAILQTTNQQGVRRSSASAYLWPATNRENLHVSLNSLATKVLIEDVKVIGVEYYQNGQLKTIRVSREVVLSAGAIKSPHILLLSGIGPKEHLESMGVKVVKNLPGVGENFHDHIAHSLKFTINEKDEYDNDFNVVTEYVANQTGPLSGLGLVGVSGRLWTKASSPNFPNIQFIFNGYSSTCAPGEIGALVSAGRRTVGIHVTNLHPKSRGRISLASNDPFEYPVIWANYLGDSSDLDILLEGIELALPIADTQTMQAYNFTLSDSDVEACANYTYPSTEYWACAIRNSAISDYHPGGSCKMGPPSDHMAVVDPRLRVHGIKGLRVADASIMPQITSGNIGAPTMMIGERAADFIKEDWGL